MYRADETSINRGNVNLYAWLLDRAPRRTARAIRSPCTRARSRGSRSWCPGETPLPGQRLGRDRLAGDPGRGPRLHRRRLRHRPRGGTRSRAPTRCASPRATRRRARRCRARSANGYRQFSVSLGTVGTQTLTVTRPDERRDRRHDQRRRSGDPERGRPLRRSPRSPRRMTAGAPVTRDDPRHRRERQHDPRTTPATRACAANTGAGQHLARADRVHRRRVDRPDDASAAPAARCRFTLLRLRRAAAHRAPATRSPS